MLIRLATLLSLATLPAAAQVACPLMLTTGTSTPDSLKIAIRNKGKIPVTSLSLACTPGPDRRAHNTICHTEAGIFYPGTPYFLTIPYPAANRQTITVSLKSAQLAEGPVWTTRSTDPCRALRIPALR